MGVERNVSGSKEKLGSSFWGCGSAAAFRYVKFKVAAKANVRGKEINGGWRTKKCIALKN